MAAKHVFVSYAREDKAFARELSRRLRGSHVTAWQDIQDLRGGDSWQERIDNALRNASALIVIMSPHATKSQFVTYEWAFAIGAGIRVIPVVLRRTKLHPRLSAIQFIDFTKRKAWVSLRQSLRFAWRKLRVAAPVVQARFALEDQNPEKSAGGYVIYASVSRAPRNTRRVTYEIYDETQKLLKLSSANAAKDFEVGFTTDGDVLVKATLRTASRTISVDSPLLEALRRSHRRYKSESVRNALDQIKEN